jgi:membrane protease YdiL (CAAX protease family)
MSDISIPLTHRMPEAHSPATTNSTAQPTPLGLWTTLAVGAAGIAAIFSTWLVQKMLISPSTPTNVLKIFYLPIHQILTVAVVAAALLMTGRPFRQYLALLPLRWGGIARSIGYGLAAYVGFVVLLGVLTLLTGNAEQGAPNVGKFSIDVEMILFLASSWTIQVVGAPIAEEVLFRGLIYRGLEVRFGAIATIVLTSVVFGLIHYPTFGWPYAVTAGCLGLLLGWMRWHTGSTTACIVTHAACNFVPALLMTAGIFVLAS